MTQLNRFDLNLLVVFEAIYAERGISRAAERLNLTQSTVSHALGRLREQIGDQLFTRRGHDMVPTAASIQLFEPICHALREIDGSIRGLERFDPVSSNRHFRIGVRGFTESVMLPRLFMAIRQLGPKMTVSAVHHGRASLAKLFHNGAIDLAVDTLAATPEGASAELLGRAPLAVMLRAGHPALARTIDLETYLQLDHVAASTNRLGTSLEDAALRAMGRTRKVVLRCQNYTTASHVVAQSDAALTMPANFSDLLAIDGVHEVVAAPFSDLSVELHMYWNARADSDPAITWLRTIAREQFSP